MTETNIRVFGRKTTIWDGWNFAFGVLTLVMVSWIVGYALDQLGWGPRFDDSDSPPIRSGVRITTDKRTGCQYFQTWSGGITPRMDKDGKHACASNLILPELPK